LAFYAITLPADTVSGAPRSVVVTEAQNGQNIQIGINDVLIVRLQAQAGTGYSWAVTTVPSFLRLSQEHTEPTGRTIPGGPEVQLFTFKPISSGNALLSFAYWRPWETGQPPARTYNVKVSVFTH
jgi:predicted secreted protein